jgi:hypothetical protein
MQFYHYIFKVFNMSLFTRLSYLLSYYIKLTYNLVIILNYIHIYSKCKIHYPQINPNHHLSYYHAINPTLLIFPIIFSLSNYYYIKIFQIKHHLDNILRYKHKIQDTKKIGIYVNMNVKKIIKLIFMWDVLIAAHLFLINKIRMVIGF